MAGSSEDNSKTRDFICGVVEGFYGRPWTTEQRKDLFQKLKKWGMDSYVYAPKDDYKHRAYWRELYTVEEAEHLTSLISAAKAQGIEFYYALSPGLDISYSNQKEIATLKRKLEQVSQFGCTAFALLFDDIEPEMSESDKQIFQSFAHAQVSVTNEIHQHLGAPRFLLCPTQYCSTRAVPNVNNSEYLNTLGSKLCQDIDIMWTGPKVISKILSSACIEEITQVLRRRPVIWDNLHANDYDQKRVFLGPYCGRSPELIPLLRGVLTNPNCEYNANFVPIRTLAHWANCSIDAPSNLDAAVCSDIKLERECEEGGCEEEITLPVNKNVYHHRQALRNAISEWLPEFSVPKNAFGPMTKPQPVINVAPAPIIPILPSVNTCMSLTAPTNTTASSTSSATLRTVPSIPSVCTSQLQALADVCAGAANSGLEGSPSICAGDVGSSENFNPISNPIMNSLVSPTKVVMNESIPNPIPQIVSSNISVPTEIPLSSIPVPILKTLEVHEKKAEIEESEADHAMTEETEEGDSGMGTTNGLVNSTLGLSSDSNVSQNDSKKEDAETDSDTIVVDDVDLTAVNPQLHNGMSVESGSGSFPMSPVDGGESMESHAHTEDDVVMNDTLSESGSMQVEAASSPLGSDMMTESSDVADSASDNALTLDDLNLLCDLFYLPFEHGSRALKLLHDFNWLISHAASLLAEGNKAKTREERQEVGAKGKEGSAEAVEWRRRSSRFLSQCNAVSRLERRLARCRNRELTHDLYTYAFDLRGVVDLLTGYVKWLGLAKFPASVNSHMQASYTWFSKGWREAFESGDQEPWVFRGGLTADLRRLVAVECGGGELASSRAPVSNTVPLAPPTVQYTLRPYNYLDEKRVCTICHETCRDGTDCTDLFPTDLQSLPADRLVAPFLNMTPEFCMVVEDNSEFTQNTEQEVSNGDIKLENGAKEKTKKTLVGYACAALDSREFYRNQEMAWIPAMCEKYPMEMIEGRDLSTAAKEWIQHFHKFKYWLPDNIHKQHPSIVTCSVLGQCEDPSVPSRLLTCLLAALRANGSSGVHVCINSTDHFMHQFYTKLGFLQLAQDSVDDRVYLGRTF